MKKYVMHFKNISLLLAVTVFIVACESMTDEEVAAQKEILDEVKSLRQDMSQWRQVMLDGEKNVDKSNAELKALRQEVAQLQKAVTEIHRVAIKSDTAPAKKRVVAANVEVDLTRKVALGSDDAQIAIVEFSDFQCPFCGRFHKNTFPSIKKDYIDTGKVKYVLMDYPLGFHNKAKGAAIAANCAAEQDAYWVMKDSLFENQRKLGTPLYKELAQTHKLDLAKYETCLDDPDQGEQVDKDFLYGQNLGVSGTPHFFVGLVKDGKLVKAQRLAGAQPFSSFETAIKSFL